MLEAGGCHCGAVRYRIDAEPVFIGVCHCSDCRRHAGALAVAWISIPAAGLTVTLGKVSPYASSPGVERQFCGTCGTGLFYYNESFLPGLVDIQLITLDNAADIKPQMHLQMADALPWEKDLLHIPKFERYPEALAHYH
ncbi:MAG: GFA family protein [Sphingomonadales bacterium]|nr:GFA family protein [Sphingomonadales bacterium]